MPDLALALGIVTLGYVLFIFDGWHKLFRDSDAGWHIRTGETILLEKSLPRADPYSFTRAGSPWIDWEWGSDLMIGIVHKRGGMAGVALLFSVAIALCTWLWVKLTWQMGGDFLLTCLFAAPMLSTVNIHWLARPHVFGWLLLLVWIWLLERGLNRRSWIVAVAFGALWANVHGSFILAPLTALLYSAGRLFGYLIFDKHDSWKSALQPATLGAFATLGSLINPYGIGLHRHVIAYLFDTELLARVGEFQSFNFHASGSGWIVISVIIAALGGSIALVNRRPEHFFVATFFLIAALRSARGLPILALCVLPLANANIAAALRRAAGLATGRRRRLRDALDYSARLRVIDQRLSGWMLAVIAIFALGLLTPHMPAGFPADQFPVTASDAVDKLPPDARILAPDMFGGYLIYHFSGRRKVFFDGRSDFYGTAFMKEYLRLVEVRPGWRAIADRYNFTHALLPHDSPLLAALQTEGWNEMYKDGTATLLAARR